MRLILLRHGETDWNALDRYQGHTDIELNAEGERQARRAAGGPVGDLIEDAEELLGEVVDTRAGPAQRVFGSVVYAGNGVVGEGEDEAEAEFAGDWGLVLVQLERLPCPHAKQAE